MTHSTHSSWQQREHPDPDLDIPLLPSYPPVPADSSVAAENAKLPQWLIWAARQTVEFVEAHWTKFILQRLHFHLSSSEKYAIVKPGFQVGGPERK